MIKDNLNDDRYENVLAAIRKKGEIKLWGLIKEPDVWKITEHDDIKGYRISYINPENGKLFEEYKFGEKINNIK